LFGSIEKRQEEELANTSKLHERVYMDHLSYKLTI